MTYKPRLLFFLITLLVTNAFGQAPVITHVDKYVNGSGQKIIISGSNFGGIPANLKIWFGAAEGIIESATDQTIEALVPPGATYESIVVTNTSTGKSARSQGEFLLSYGGENPISLAKLVPQSHLDAESGLYDLCMCDLDGDGMTDVAGANSGTSNSTPLFGVSLFRNANVTPGGAFAFDPKVSMLATTKALNIKCGDLNGDGKKDLVISEADPGNRIFILKNSSVSGSLSFSAQNFTVLGKSPKRVDVADLDQDGLPEIIVTDQNTGNKDLLIFPNTSSGGTISFALPVILPVVTTGSDGLAIQDLDNDNRPEIIISHVLSSLGNVYVYRNQSHPGTFVFTDVIKADIAPGSANNTGAPVNVRVGDIDGDMKPDIAVTHFLASKVSVLLNQSSTGAISFGAPVSVVTAALPFGIDLGDLDGDGKIDITVASLTSPDENPLALTILNNTSTPGSVSFATPLIKPTTFVNRHVLVGDLNGDSKPDIAYTSVDDNTRGVPASKISFFRNQSCIVPEVTPGGTMVVCASFPIELTPTESAGATYAWSKDGTPLGITTQTYTPSVTGIYTVEMTSDGCTKTSSGVDVTVSVAGAAAAPSFSNNSPLCKDGTINITATSAGGDTFNWTGPDGFTAVGPTISRASYKPEFAGLYEVEIKAGGCIAAKGSTLVETISLPAFNVGLSGSDVICAGVKTLTVVPTMANFTYQWMDANVNIGGETGATYDAGATGSYSFKATSSLYPGCPEVLTEAVDILLATMPVVDFESPAETCKDVVTRFTNQSTGLAAAGINYDWDFGDTGTSTEADPTHTYTSIADRTVTLTVSYRGNACPVSVGKPIKISAPPTATITSEGNVFEFCDGEQVALAVSGTFSEYKWSTDEITPTINVTTEGTYEVKLKNTVGCTISISQFVDMLPAPDIAITAEKNPINIGEQTKLSASNGFSAYEWTPGESLDDPASQNPIATPIVDTDYTVAVMGSNGCAGTALLKLVVIVDNPTNLLQIANFFSPNGDDSNPYWLVKPDAIVKNCGVTIFDEKGVKVFEATPYNNDWDGTNNGKKLPDGVYYYMIRCDGDSSSKSGSITILR